MNCGYSSVGGGSSDKSRGNNKEWGADEERAETKRNLGVGLSKKDKERPSHGGANTNSKDYNSTRSKHLFNTYHGPDTMTNQHFMCLNAFIPHNDPEKQLFLLMPIFQLRNVPVG